MSIHSRESTRSHSRQRTRRNTITTKPGFITVTATPLAPVAEFSAIPLDGIAPLSVAFTDLSTNTPTSWFWSFGDGNTSTKPDPVNVYTLPGVYPVSLTATNTARSTITTKPGFITVTAPPLAPVAEFSAIPLTGLLRYQSHSPIYPQTHRHPGSGRSGMETPDPEPDSVNVYTLPGVYPVSLTATNTAGSTITTKPGFITVTAISTRSRSLNSRQSPWTGLLGYQSHSPIYPQIHRHPGSGRSGMETPSTITGSRECLYTTGSIPGLTHGNEHRTVSTITTKPGFITVTGDSYSARSR